MGCGCKNNGNQTPPPPPPNPSAPKQNRVVNEDVKNAVRKTIEKYYNVNKTQK